MRPIGLVYGLAQTNANRHAACRMVHAIHADAEQKLCLNWGDYEILHAHAATLYSLWVDKAGEACLSGSIENSVWIVRIKLLNWIYDFYNQNTSVQLKNELFANFKVPPAIRVFSVNNLWLIWAWFIQMYIKQYAKLRPSSRQLIVRPQELSACQK